MHELIVGEVAAAICIDLVEDLKPELAMLYCFKNLEFNQFGTIELFRIQTTIIEARFAAICATECGWQKTIGGFEESQAHFEGLL